MKQSDAIKIILHTRNNIFLTGDAGSGKTHLTRRFISECPTQVSITASTGIAATLLGGTTAHSFFGIGKGGVKAFNDALANRRAVNRIRMCDTVIIDEISMLGRKVLELIDRVAREVRGSKAPFGGIRVIAVGDFNQLCPVDDEWAFKSPLWKTFVPIYLTEQFRSKDENLVECLKDIRSGKLFPETRAFLDAQMKIKPSKMVRLLPYNKGVEEYNLDKLDKLPAKALKFETKYKWKNKRGNYYDHQRNFPIPPELKFKVGAQVMIRKNAYDKNGGIHYVNGDLGKIVEMDPEVVYVERYSDNAIIPIGVTEFTIDDPLDGEPIISAFNVPLNLSWATSIHKSQGQTLSRVAMDLSRCFAPGQFYVALSRASDSSTLSVLGWDKKSILVDRDVINYYAGILQQ
jgi:ATP-dependent exoDNAse (exonuclease V) alpha subunit